MLNKSKARILRAYALWIFCCVLFLAVTRCSFWFS